LYGQKDIPCSGPLFREATVEGGRMRVRFDLPSGPLVTAGGEPVQGFVLAGADGVFHPAKATIDGDSVLVETAEVTAPRAVRYAWANNPICNLRDTAGWPAEPFRTDTGG
jgi:sialate O-acetylesterase